MKRFLELLLLSGFALQLSGCLIPGVWPLDDDDHEPEDEPFVDPPPPGGGFTPEGGAIIPPSIDAVNIPSWPPLGPHGELSVMVSDDFGLDRVTFDFRNHFTEIVSGTTLDNVFVTGAELGEGFGTLTIQLFDIEGATATRGVTDLLVDLSPPKADLGKRMVRAKDDHLELWVSDAWVLGAVTLTFQGDTQVQVFEEVYPSTLGESWDYSLVKFASESLSPGVAEAELTVSDAAGNTSTQSFELTVDGTLPVVSVSQPAPGATVSGPFTVSVQASDAEGGAVWIELEIDGTPLATAVGPAALIEVDAAELTPGAATLTVKALDEAGNVGTTQVPIVIQ